MKATVLVLLLCVIKTFADDYSENHSVRVALKVYDDCSKVDFFSCLKKKAIVMLDRLSRMEKISLSDAVTIVKTAEADPALNYSGEGLESNRSREGSLDEILFEKFTRLLGSRRIEIALPKILPTLDEGKSHYFVSKD